MYSYLLAVAVFYSAVFEMACDVTAAVPAEPNFVVAAMRVQPLSDR